jgi:hypothetical protein
MAYVDIFSFTDEMEAKNFFANEIVEDKEAAGIYIVPPGHVSFILDGNVAQGIRLNPGDQVYTVIRVNIDTILQLDQVKIRATVPAAEDADGLPEDDAAPMIDGPEL